MFYNLQDNILLINNCSALAMECFVCGRHGHTVGDCKETHMRLNPNYLIHYGVKHSNSSRNLVLRASNKKFHALKNIREVRSVVESLKQELNQINLQIPDKEDLEEDFLEEIRVKESVIATSPKVKGHDSKKLFKMLTLGDLPEEIKRKSASRMHNDKIKSRKEMYSKVIQGEDELEEEPEEEQGTLFRSSHHSIKKLQGFRNDKTKLTTLYFPKQNATDFTNFYNKKIGMYSTFHGDEEEKSQSKTPNSSDSEDSSQSSLSSRKDSGESMERMKEELEAIRRTQRFFKTTELKKPNLEGVEMV